MFRYATFLINIVLLALVCCVFSCNFEKKPKVLSGAEYKSISKILQETREVDIHLDRQMCRSLIETISKRSAMQILALKDKEKNEILRIAITATVELSPFFKAVSARVKAGLSTTLKNDSSLKKELLEAIDVSIDMTAIKVILSDDKYLENAELDSVLFGMAVILGQAVSRDGYKKTETALKEGDSKTVIDILSKTSIEVVLYSYGIVRERKDIQTMTFAGVKLIDLLPEMKVNF